MAAKIGVANLCGLSCLVTFLLSGVGLNAAPLTCDLSQYQSRPGLTADIDMDELAVQWEGESAQKLRVRFAVRDGVPIVRELSIQSAGGWIVLARDLAPEFRVTTGIRRTNHGLPEENRWDV